MKEGKSEEHDDEQAVSKVEGKKRLAAACRKKKTRWKTNGGGTRVQEGGKKDGEGNKRRKADVSKTKKGAESAARAEKSCMAIYSEKKRTRKRKRKKNVRRVIGRGNRETRKKGRAAGLRRKNAIDVTNRRRTMASAVRQWPGKACRPKETAR